MGRLARRLRRLHAGLPSEGGGPTFLELAMLVRLSRSGPSSVSQIARGERVTTQAVSAALAGLERRRLVDTAADPADGRRTLVSVNDAGRVELAHRDDAVGARLATALEELTPAELDRIVTATPLLDRLADLL